MRGVDRARRHVPGLSLRLAQRLHERAHWSRFAANQSRSFAFERGDIVRLGFGLRSIHQGFGPKNTSSRAMSETFESSRAPEPVGAFPHAKRVGQFLFLSGIGPRTRGSKEIPGVSLDSAGNI